MSHDPLAGLADLDDEAGATHTEAAGLSGATKDDASTGVIKLESNLTIADAATCHKAWLSQMDQAKGISLDASDLEMIDGTGLQLLAALFKEANERDIPIAWASTSGSLINAANGIGLTGVLALDKQ